MVAAFCCNDLVNQGLPVYLAAAITVAGAGVAGVVIYVIVMRPLRNASSLSQVIATIGLLVTLVGIAVLAWNDVALRGQLAPSLVPTDPVTFFGSSFGVDRLWLLGISPDRVAAGNWAIGFGVAAFAGILIAPITALNVTALAFIILPALAAAVVGRFTSFGLTVAAGVLIGVSQSLITRYWTLQGMSAAFPLFVVIV